MPDPVIVITNGDAAVEAIRKTGLSLDQILPWRDVLHEGPVPGHVSHDALRVIRAQYLAERGYGIMATIAGQFDERDRVIDSCDRFYEVVLWFEHDLYDQLQLLQVLSRLDRLSADRVSIVCRDAFVSQQSARELERQFGDRRPVTDEMFAEAVHAWSCFVDPDPTQLATIAGRRSPGSLPYLPAAVNRLIGEFPDRETGLSLTEEFVLRRLNTHGLQSAAEMFRELTAAEDAEFLGDWTFFRILLDLAAAPHPLIEPAAQSGPIPGELTVGDCARLAFRILPLGRRVIQSKVNAVAMRGIDRWIGGVHLISEAVWERTTARAGRKPTFQLRGPISRASGGDHSSNLR